LADTATKGKQSQERISQAAFRLFLANGYHGTSMRAIAEAAGLAAASLYNHFPSKEAIFKDVIEGFHPYREIIAALSAAEGRSVEALVRSAADGIIQVIAKRRDVVNLLFIELVEFDGRHANALFQTVFPQAMPFIQKLEEASGAMRPIAAPDRMLALIGVMVSQWLMSLMFALDEAQLRARLDQAVDIYLYGILEEKTEIL
jgi:AcrR family transcriptional regulator